jgi:chemotaxis protein MotB
MSSAHHEPTEPRIVKKKKAPQATHGGAWKVAYADFVTAMMALFIVLWIMSQSQSIRLNVAQYFKNPGLLPGATGLLETSDMGGKMPTPGHSQELQTPAPIRPEVNRAPSDRGSLEEVKKRITEIIAQLPELSRLKNQVALEITDEGLRIELLDQEHSHFFDIGSANLKPETQKLLKLIAQELGKVPNHVTIEGHTDSRPYGGKDYTNWELSADRANAARRVIEEGGVKKNQLTSVRGCADRQLRNQKDPLDVQNRRVSIVVRFQDGSKPQPLKLPPLPETSVVPAPKLDSPEPALPASTPAKAVPVQKPDTPPVQAPDTAPAQKPEAAPGRTSDTAPVQNPAPEAAAPPSPPASQPGKAEETSSAAPPEKAEPAPGPVFNGHIQPPAQRLEDEVRQEVQQLFEQEADPSPGPGESLGLNQKPRQRLGW